MRKAILSFHQGWTDIINQLALINFYEKKYDLIELYIRNESKELIEFYCRNLKKISINYINKDSVHSCDFLGQKDINEYDLVLHGSLDRFRKDNYRNKFYSDIHSRMEYISSFYLSYNIPIENKIFFFELDRDLVKEDYEYNNFISKHGSNYILYHFDQNFPGGDTGIDLSEILKEKNIPAINLNGLFDNPFLSIKILQNAKELHLTDSMWGSICYLLECKYNIFKNNIVYYYPYKTRCGGLFCEDNTRNYYDLPPQTKFYPINISNWNIIKL
jgi:hypothetical protein